MSRPLFETVPELERLLAQSSHMLLCLDFGGTVAPMVDDPQDAALAPGLRRTIQSLTHKHKVSVAVLSGRDRSDLQARIPIPNLFYVGNHGLEISGPGVLFIEPASASCSEAIKNLGTELRARVEPIAGALVEDKGLTLSVHYRMVAADYHEEVRQMVHAALARANYPFQLRMGNKVYEIRPRVSWTKGSAVAWIKEQIDKPNALVVYLGDDATDEDAFAALPDAITVKVGDPSETVARYHLQGPAEVQAFLRWLDERIP